MQKRVIKYSIIFFLLLVYINRGFFIVPYEAENNGNNEVNSIIEWITQLVTGASNDIDEDGDMQTDCSCTHIILYDFPMQFVQIEVFSKDITKIGTPYKENFYLKNFCTQIDHPPEV